MKNIAKGVGSFLSKKAGVWILGLVGLTSVTFIAIVVVLVIVIVLIFGMADMNNSGGGDSDFTGGEFQVNGLSKHVLEYENLIKKHATEQGIEEYTPVILSLLQRESGGSPDLSDPMQSSESLCGAIGCITNPDHSFKQGVKEFKRVLVLADHDLKLALSSYNFGSGFVTKMKKDGNTFEFDKKIGGLETSSHALKFSQDQYANALDKSNYTCSRQGVNLEPYKACYGDIFYVQDVLSRIEILDEGGFDLKDGNASEIRQSIATVGEKWIGNTEYHWGGGRSEETASRGEFDCSSFVHWAYKKNGIELGNIGSVSTETLNKMGKKIHYNEIQVGDLMFWDSYKVDGHVAIYIGNGEFIGSQSSTGVAKFKKSNTYWSPLFNGHVRRIVND